MNQTLSSNFVDFTDEVINESYFAVASHGATCLTFETVTSVQTQILIHFGAAKFIERDIQGVRCAQVAQFQFQA